MDLNIPDIIKNSGTLIGQIRSAITGEMGPESKAQIELALNQIEANISQAQSHTNDIEAANTNLFISGWRPFTGWVLAAIVAFHFLLRPLIIWIMGIFGITIILPAFDLTTVLTLFAGMLGLSGMRTLDKLNGVDSAIQTIFRSKKDQEKINDNSKMR